MSKEAKVTATDAASQRTAQLFEDLVKALGPIVGSLAFKVATKSLGLEVTDTEAKRLHVRRSRKLGGDCCEG